MTDNRNHGMIRGSIFNDNCRPVGWPTLKKKIDKQLERSKKWITKLNAKEATSIRNSKNIPSNTTIRQEYVKCGKWDCPRCEHGPYYYAYSKENGKLRKKYIGEYRPSMRDKTKRG
jgi:hypothetical protein